MKRLIDITLALMLTPLFIPLLIIAIVLVKFTSKGPAIYWSNRVGRHGKLFLMPKIRTMLAGTPPLASDLIDAKVHLNPVGSILRKSSIDEIPQIWSVFLGEMSFVGPRPALFNQTELIRLREDKGIHSLRPGITGLAQINGRNSLSLEDKVFFDELYLSKNSIFEDIKIILITIKKVLIRDSISH